MSKPRNRCYKCPGLVFAAIILLTSLSTPPMHLVQYAYAGGSAGSRQEPGKSGKLEYVDHLTREDLASVASVEVSPDGQFIYAAAYNVGALSIFKRDKDTGCIEHLQTISRDQDEDMYGAVNARVSPCGRYLVCSTIRSYAVYLFERDQSTGTLKVLDKVKEGEDGAENLVYLPDAAFSPDSQFVYVVSDQSGALTVFKITEDKKLAFIECTKGENNCLDGARHLNISPDGKHIYIVSWRNNNLVVLARDVRTGKTKLKQVIEDEEGDVHSLAGVFYVCCSPDNRFVYTSAGRFTGDNAICVFQKNADGTLKLVQEVIDGQGGLTGFVGGNKALVSQDGQNFYAIGSRSNSVVAFSRNTENGRLTYLQTFYDSEVAGKDGSASGLGMSPDGEYVYVGGEYDSSVLIFKRLTGSKSGALHKAAFLGDIAQVKELLEIGADVNEKGERGYVPLHWAVTGNQKDVAELLLQAGANIDTRTGTGGWTPLQLAIIQRNKNLAEWLISKGAKLNIKNHNNGLTPLFIAGMGGKVDLVQLLLSNGANVNVRDHELNTPLHCSARDGYIDVARALIDAGADIKATNNWGATALHYSVMRGRTSIAQLLIEKGADINIETDEGFTPLIYAALSGRREIIELLLSEGVDITAKDNQGRDALWWARTRKRNRIVRLLQDHGAKDSQEEQSFEEAILSDNIGRVKELIAQGVNINLPDSRGNTPLLQAIKIGRRSFVETLISGGADVNAKDRRGQTPLDIANERGWTEIVELLRKHGAKE